MKLLRNLLAFLSLSAALAAAQTTAPITVTVTDANGNKVSQTYNPTVISPVAVPPLAIATTTIPNIIIGTPYTATILFSGGTGPYTCTATGLPVGLPIATGAAGNCIISGTATGLASNPPPPSPTGGTGYVALPLTTAPVMYPNIATGVFTDLSSIEPFFGTWEYNQPITNAPVHALSATIMAGLAGIKPSIDQTWGINVVDSSVTPYSPLTLVDTADSLVTLVPVPANGGWVEGGGAIGVYPNDGGDAHRILFDRATGFEYESFVTSSAYAANASQFWDTTSPLANRPYEMTSLSADGLPILPGILDYNEALVGIKHALRVTFPTIDGHKFMEPASHSGTPAAPGNPIMGSRLRLRASWQPAAGVTLSVVDQNIIAALKTYGLYVCDTGSGGIISSTDDPRWAGTDGQATDILKIFGRNNTALLSLSNFDMVDTGQPIETYYAESPKGQGPNILSFTGTRDATGVNEIFTVNSTGAYYSYLNGYVPFRGNTVEIPYQSGVTVTLTQCNIYACSSAQAVMQ